MSVALFGSVARATARPGSDIDILIVLDDAILSYSRRLEPVVEAISRARDLDVWRQLQRQHGAAEINTIVLSREEAEENRLVFLDMTEEAIILFDREQFLVRRLEALCRRLEDLGARKRLRNRGWCWNLKPDWSPGAAVVI